ncbi:MAG: 2-oxoacid:acceptor oxidoreductase family protein, partial [Deltaproteobacteria bacterium]|nr:2-oxoacid:acceptor oxidoreductase family protein [Deltaproteobacteria bacterium]
MSSSTQSILLAGVGGQGILRASDILSLALMEAGFDAKKSEVHGMAQRGGCVTSHVRYGTKVYSPIAKKRDINIL